MSPIAASLAKRMGVRASRASADDIADAIVATARDIEHTLLPIVGRKGVEALWQRSLFLARAEHDWLKTTPGEPTMAIELIALKTALRQQSAADATTAGVALLTIFTDLLISLIGSSLTERLLRPVWSIPGIEPLTLVRST